MVKPPFFVLAGCMPILITSPIPIIDDIIELKPLLKNGSGRPVFGKRNVTTQILLNTWNINIADTPTAINIPRKSCALLATRKHLKIKMPNKSNTRQHPRKPNSSEITLQIKSLSRIDTLEYALELPALAPSFKNLPYNPPSAIALTEDFCCLFRSTIRFTVES